MLRFPPRVEADQQPWLDGAPRYDWALLDDFSRRKEHHVLCVGSFNRGNVDAVHPCNLLCQTTVGVDVLVVGRGYRQQSGHAYRPPPRPPAAHALRRPPAGEPAHREAATYTPGAEPRDGAQRCDLLANLHRRLAGTAALLVLRSTTDQYYSEYLRVPASKDYSVLVRVLASTSTFLEGTVVRIDEVIK